MRYLRAFFKALALTLKGNPIKAPSARYPHLYGWMKQGQQLVEAVYETAEQAGIDEDARQKFMLHLDSRDWSMELILAAVRYHLRAEYPSLLEAKVGHHITAVYALNVDDQYRVSQLVEADGLQDEVRDSIRELSTHLQKIPPSNEP